MLIKNWRNQQIDFLRQTTLLTNKDQKEYYNNFILPSFSTNKPKIILFSFMKLKKCIGYGGLINIDWNSKRAELSFLLDTNRSKNLKIYRKEFKIFLNLITRLSFVELKLNRLFTETFDIRPVHIDVLQKFGFKFEGRLKKHTFVQGRFVDSLIHGYLKEYYICE
jgi:RimJ/RimL family protein N-acetyltransferase